MWLIWKCCRSGLFLPRSSILVGTALYLWYYYRWFVTLPDASLPILRVDTVLALLAVIQVLLCDIVCNKYCKRVKILHTRECHGRLLHTYAVRRKVKILHTNEYPP